MLIHSTAVIDEAVLIGEGTKIWHFCHVCSGASIGQDCSFGQNVMVGSDVVIGDRVKIQNNVAIYTGVTVEDEVFLGPSCVLTNVTNPRSQVARKTLYEPTLIRRGATIGANATMVCGITLGKYCFVGAGAVVTKDVPDYGLILGNPGRLKGYMSRHGHKLSFNDEGEARCPESEYLYVRNEDEVRCKDLPEDAALPDDLAVGSQNYDFFKNTEI